MSRLRRNALSLPELRCRLTRLGGPMKRVWTSAFFCSGIAGSLAVVASVGFVLRSEPVVAQTARSAEGGAPVFEVDLAWPKPLPNNWTLGPVSGIAVDARDHVWITHRVKQAPGVPAPDVIEFDQQGNIVQTWTPGTGSGYEWMEQVHGITVDSKDHVWISGNDMILMPTFSSSHAPGSLSSR